MTTLKQAFWEAFGETPLVMLELDGDSRGAAPMMAQLNPDAHGAIWFFTARAGHFAAMGPAWASFVAKDHALFARFSGHLVEETDPAIRPRLWSNAVAAWFPDGQDAGDVLLMRMDLGDAAIWGADLGFVGTAKLMLGMDVRHEVEGKKAVVHL